MGAIYLIRHGQAGFGKAHYDQLSETGHRQAEILGHALHPRVPDVHAVVTGGMRRHQETAQGVLRGLRFSSEMRIDAGWNEYDHEEVIHRYKPTYRHRAVMMADLAKTLNPRRAFQDMFAKAIQRWMSGEHNDDYAETWPQFQRRCVSALYSLVNDLGKSKTALVFTSGGPITAVAQHLLHIPDSNVFGLNWTLANCGVTKVIYSDRGTYLSSLNEHTAFEGQHRDLLTYR